MNNSEWLESLKIGDEVAVDTGRHGYKNYEIIKIERITPTRRISLEGRSWKFDSNGRERGKVNSWTPRKCIKPVTQDIRDSIRKKYIISRIESVKWETVSLDKLEKILEIIDGRKANE